MSRTIKTKVQSNMGAPYAQRYFNTLWTYRIAQLTTSNVRRLKEYSLDLGIGNPGGAVGSSSAQQKEQQEATAPVKSDLQPHAMHKFSSETDWSVVVAVPRSSPHYRNVLECKKVSLMIGHTDPQLFHWFRELGALPPRALLSGSAELLTGDLMHEVWEQTLVRHPVIHRMAQDMWESDASKTQAEKEHIARREYEEDEKRMRRMSSSDWRAKFKDRERNPTASEDEEAPIYIMKPDTFAVLRVRPEVKLWMGVAGPETAQRVWETAIADADPLCRCAPRFIAMLNLSRAKLISTLNMNYSLRLTNVFITAIDKGGLWAMGTQESTANNNGQVREEWSELRLEFGKDQEITTEQEMEWWVRGLTKLGSPEVTQMDNSIQDASLDPDQYEFRHS